jgi:acetoin utilization protein AcuB
MFVRDRMSTPAVTIPSDTPFQEALQNMQDHGFRRLPVVDGKGRLVGIISERDLLHASPSSATSLSIWEIHYLLYKIRIRELMTAKVISTSPDTPVEEAARLMAANKIGALPVVSDDGIVVGVITETDNFKTFIEMFAGTTPSTRLTMEVPERKGVLARLAQTIFELGGSIESVGAFHSSDTGMRTLVVKVQDVGQAKLLEALEALGEHVVDARDV